MRSLNIKIIALLLLPFMTSAKQYGETYSQECATISPSAGLLQAAGYSPECVALSLAKCHCIGTDNIKHIRPRNCQELLDNGEKNSGLKTIYPWRMYPTISETVFCDQVTDGAEVGGR